MIRKVMIFLVLVLPVSLRGADRNFQAGLAGGMSATQVAGDGLSGFHKPGLILGGFVHRKLSEAIGMRMEIDFIQKGSRDPYNKETGHYYVMRLSYFEVPVLVTWDARPPFSVEAGPSFGALVFSEEEDEFGVERYRPEFKTFDLSLHVGINYQLSDHWQAGFRYSNSVIPIRDYAEGYSFANFKKGQYNTVLMFIFRYRF
jgi:hypothetical protein